eukprot:777009-Pleurochrysis_carterae.AAC.1
MTSGSNVVKTRVPNTSNDTRWLCVRAERWYSGVGYRMPRYSGIFLTPPPCEYSGNKHHKATFITVSRIRRNTRGSWLREEVREVVRAADEWDSDVVFFDVFTDKEVMAVDD